jgi:predicted deacetylase
MAAEYLLRFDDLCPTMNWANWQRIEQILLNLQISPVLAVVPDNRDSSLEVSPAKPEFWDNVREWQARGWTIGMHGWQHRFATGDSGIVGVTSRSEFAGLPRNVQLHKISAATNKFKEQRISSKLWIAPAHSFDHVTVQLLREFEVEYISDGFAVWPFSDSSGMMWIPQQLWSFRYRPFGVWTICFHINSWTNADLERFRSSVSTYRELISRFSEVANRYHKRRKTLWDSFAARAYLYTSRAKATLSW